ncbi:hypothetical protein [uncultured Clostridium sp.]|uniref:hypothetical protein n=1 Tax=uncultured Clostridium sp. TaxID=59620 RepID=UPI0025E37219|nr:hypothetical protein [uncultured Clostridium sp.]
MELIKQNQEQMFALLKLAKKENKSASNTKKVISKEEKEIYIQKLLCKKFSTLDVNEKQAVYKWAKVQKPKYHFISKDCLKDFIKNIKSI